MSHMQPKAFCSVLNSFSDIQGLVTAVGLKMPLQQGIENFPFNYNPSVPCLSLA